MQVVEEVLPFANAFPIPPIEDIIGEEINPNQLLGHGNDIPDNINNQDLNFNPDLQGDLGVNGYPAPEPVNNFYQQQANELVGEGLPDPEQLPLQPIQDPEIENQYLQIGMALVPSYQWDNVHSEVLANKMQADYTKLWDHPTNKGNSESILIRLPLNWVNFFNSILHSPDTFDWGKKFLTSGAPALLDDNSGNISLPVPKFCSTQSINTVLQTATDEPDNGADAKIRKKKANKRPSPVVDTQVRRSERVRQGSNGFKVSNCSDRKCTTCTPPTLSTKVIKNLGTQFCSMDLATLSEDNLMKGGGTTEPVGRKKSKTKTSLDSNEDMNTSKVGHDGTEKGI